MPRQYLMNWDGAPNFRWRKMYKGVLYAVTCQDLRAPLFTKEGSGKLADEWWRKKKAALDGTTIQATVERMKGIPLDQLQAMADPMVYERQQLAKAIIEAQSLEGREAVERVLGYTPPEDDAEAADILNDVLSVIEDDAVTVTKDRTLKAVAERFLAVVQGETKPLTYRELRDYIRSMYTSPLLGAGMDVSAITERKVEDVYLGLKNAELAAGTKKKRWGFFKRFVNYVGSQRLIDPPRNLGQYGFTVEASAVKTYPLADVRTELKALPSRLKLYAMLGLNCGMTSADMGCLTKDMVSLEDGTLTRRRVKTGHIRTTPTVTYPLWPETVELLREHWSEHATHVLTSADGTVLWESRQEGDKTPTKDLITQQWKRAKKAIPLSDWKSVSSSLIEGNKAYGDWIATLFLAHSPKSVSHRHYTAPPLDVLTEAVNWLHGEIFGKVLRLAPRQG